MTGVIATIPKYQFSSALGFPLVNGTLTTYLAGTTTLTSTWQDQALTALNTNPVALDARGECVLWLDSTKNYKFVLKNSFGVVQWTQDNLSGAGAAADVLKTSLAGSAGAGLLGWIQSVAGAVLRTVQDKLRDTISVKDAVGVTGNSVTDDRAAINAMLTNLVTQLGKCEVDFPRGDYLIGSNLTIPAGVTLRFKAGARLLIPTGVTLTLLGSGLKAGRHQVFVCTGTGKVIGTVSNELIFPEWWGAIADGLYPPVGADFSARAAAAARNSDPINAAIAFAGYSYPINGLTGTVSLTYGYYLHDKTIKVPLSVNVVGYGIGSGLFYYAPTGNAMECIGSNNSMLKDFFLAPIGGVAGATAWNFTTGYGLYMDGVSTPIVDNIWSSSFGGGTFFFKSVIEGRIRGCISDNSNGPAFVVRGVGQGTIFENCVTAGNMAACFDIQLGYDHTFIGCTAKDGAGGTNGFYLSQCENINLIGCHAYSTNMDSYLLTASALNCTLTNCMAYEPGTGAAAGAYHGFNISGTRNKLTACKVTGNTPNYGYGITFGGGATDCTSINHNITPGVNGSVFDGQPNGNNTYQIHKVVTADATPKDIWFKSLNNNSGVLLEATVMAKQSGLGGATAAYKFYAYVRTDSTGTAILSGPTSIYSYESLAALNATFVLTDATANAGKVSLQVTGTIGNPTSWEALVTAMSATG